MDANRISSKKERRVDISQFFIRCDVKGAIEYMKSHDEFKEILPSYTAIFEDCKYLSYDIPDSLDKILRLYQIYYRDIFYCGMKESEAESKLLSGLKELLGIPNADEAILAEKLQELFENNGYHALFGKTQGFYGPYIWKETVPTTYCVELPEGSNEYKVNILKGFVFRSWMDYLTFGRFGTGGWVSPDGTINCIEKAYDFESERFLVSLLKHEAQHTLDVKKYQGITTEELEYRAKLVELHYSTNPALLQKFFAEAGNERHDDSHALASFKIKESFKDIDQNDISAIQKKALDLFFLNNKEMEKKYTS